MCFIHFWACERIWRMSSGEQVLNTTRDLVKIKKHRSRSAFREQGKRKLTSAAAIVLNNLLMHCVCILTTIQFVWATSRATWIQFIAKMTPTVVCVFRLAEWSLCKAGGYLDWRRDSLVLGLGQTEIRTCSFNLNFTPDSDAGWCSVFCVDCSFGCFSFLLSFIVTGSLALSTC